MPGPAKPRQPSRRDVLKTAAAVTAAAAIGAPLPVRAQGARAGAGAIDAVLQAGVAAGDVPGVVAMAADAQGVFYEAAFGSRNLASGPAMTRDTVFRIASMTKAVTSVAALQLVERGKLKLDGPVPAIDKALSKPQVLDGFDASGKPMLRPAKGPVTLRQLLTHTAGFTYEVWDAETQRYVKYANMPSTATGKIAALRMPLRFDPGTQWEYGVNIDWVGLLIQHVSGKPLDVYFQENVFQPLGMVDSGFAVTPEQRARQTNFHQRQGDGSLAPQPLETWFKPEFYAGGGGLYSTARDYMTFCRTLMAGGSFNGIRILKPETVAMLGQNQIGAIEAGKLKTTTPGRSADVDFFPGQSLKWGLATMINAQPGPNGRSAGSLTWAGIFNTYYWIDPVKKVTGVYMAQVLPFADPRAVKVFGQFERAVYNATATA